MSTDGPLQEAPRLNDLGVEPWIVENFKFRSGLVIISGGAASGKSKLLAGMVRELLEDPESHLNIIEYAAQVEFNYEHIKTLSATIAHSDIPEQLPSFKAAVGNALARHADVVVVGEARDADTVQAVGELAIAGCCVMTTVTAGSVSETLLHCINLCPEQEREAVTRDLVSTLRLIVNQRLVPSTNGAQTVLREFLVFDRSLRQRLLDAQPDTWRSVCGNALATNGQSFAQAARVALREGRISEETETAIRKEFGDVA
jgi:defect-in-organelle-trafficking protein DotB